MGYLEVFLASRSPLAAHFISESGCFSSRILQDYSEKSDQRPMTTKIESARNTMFRGITS